MADDLHPAISEVPWKRLLLPSEHGSWAFVLEPLVFGLIVAWSPAAAWVSLAVIFGFISRKPARFAVARATVGSAKTLRRAARAVLLILTVAAAVSLACAVSQSRWQALLPLALSLPPLFIFFRREQEQRTRSLATELVATGICSMPLLAIAIAANLNITSALTLGAVSLARAWPTLLYVRACLRGPRGETGQRMPAVVAQIVAPALLALLAMRQVLPWLVVVYALVLSLRALFFLYATQTRPTAKQLGVMEVAWGIFYTLATSFTCRG